MKQFLKALTNYRHIHVVTIVLAVTISFLLHLPIFKLNLIGYHVWRQTQTQTVIENFCTEDFCILNPRLNNLSFPDRIIRMEFPLYQWIVAFFCKLFGNHVLVTRIVTFIIGIFSISGFYLLASSVFKNKKMAAVGAWAICFSPVFYYYTINPLPDNLALCFGIYALYFFSRYYAEAKLKYLILFSASVSLAALCKLPFILFIVPFAVYWIKNSKKVLEAGIVLLFLLPAIIWYACVIGTWGDNGIIKGVLNSDITLTNYLDYIAHNFISTIPELYINYAALFLFVVGVFLAVKRKIILKNKMATYLFFGFMGVLAYIFFELNMIATVHDYYLFPLLPFLFLISLYGFNVLIQQKNRFLKTMAILCILLMPLTAYLRSQTRWNVVNPGFNKALYLYKTQIEKIIPQNAICLTGNDNSGMINLYYLNRKGYTFFEDQLNVDIINHYKQKGVSYLVSNAVLNENTKQFLPAPIAIFGDLKIYKLQ